MCVAHVLTELKFKLLVLFNSSELIVNSDSFVKIIAYILSSNCGKMLDK